MVDAKLSRSHLGREQGRVGPSGLKSCPEVLVRPQRLKGRGRGVGRTICSFSICLLLVISSDRTLLASFPLSSFTSTRDGPQAPRVQQRAVQGEMTMPGLWLKCWKRAKGMKMQLEILK